MCQRRRYGTTELSTGTGSLREYLIRNEPEPLDEIAAPQAHGMGLQFCNIGSPNA